MKQNIPTARFEEPEADRLIAAFGIKPSHENKQQMEDFLRQQKGKFIDQERQREARVNAPNRTR
jgi:hypothetical protein